MQYDELLKKLNSLNTEYMIIGGTALYLQGFNFTTEEFLSWM